MVVIIQDNNTLALLKFFLFLKYKSAIYADNAVINP